MTSIRRPRRPSTGTWYGTFAVTALTAVTVLLGAVPAAAAPDEPTAATPAGVATTGDQAPTESAVTLTPGASTNPYTSGALPEPDAGQRVTWAVRPATEQGPDGRVSFRHEVAPGGTVTDRVTVSNYADRDITFKLYASDGVTTADGAFDLLPSGVPPAGGGAWVTLEQQEVTIGAQQSVTVPFTIAVPADAVPGDHPAGIVAALTTSAGADGAVGMERRVGARIHLRVPGEITPMIEVQNLSADFEGEWSLTEGGSSAIAMDLVNTGNVRVSGEATLEITGPLGLWGRTVELGTIPEILPGNQIHVTASARDVPPLIMLTHGVQVRLVAVGQDELTDLPEPQPQYARAAAMPWLWLLILLGVVGLVSYLAQGRRRARRQLAAVLAERSAQTAGSDGTGDASGGPASASAGVGTDPTGADRVEVGAGPGGEPMADGPSAADRGGRHRP